MKFSMAKILGLIAAMQLGLVASPDTALAASRSSLDAGTRLFLTLDESVSSARGGGDVGTIVRCRVWRDVENQGVTFIKAGSPAVCRVETVKRSNIGGNEGSISIAGVETHSIDGQNVMLSGGYRKEGGGNKVGVLTVGILFFWPALFIMGGNAELPPGTVFDVSTVNDLKLAAAEAATQSRVINLSGLNQGLSAEFMLDEFLAQKKHNVFRIKVSKDGQLPSTLVIDRVNDKPVEPMSLSLSKAETKDGETSAIAEISAKTLAKHFTKGINRFDVSYTDGGERKSAEVVMEIQM
jgi:hypothetical protein